MLSKEIYVMSDKKKIKIMEHLHKQDPNTRRFISYKGIPIWGKEELITWCVLEAKDRLEKECLDKKVKEIMREFKIKKLSDYKLNRLKKTIGIEK